MNRRITTLIAAGFVFAAAMATTAGVAQAHPNRGAPCTMCHNGPDAKVVVQATQVSNDGVNTTYSVTVSNTYGGTVGWAVANGAGSTLTYGSGSPGTFVVPVNATYTVWGTSDNVAKGSGTNSIAISPLSVTPTPPPTPAPTSTPSPTTPPAPTPPPVVNPPAPTPPPSNPPTVTPGPSPVPTFTPDPPSQPATGSAEGDDSHEGSHDASGTTREHHDWTSDVERRFEDAAHAVQGAVTGWVSDSSTQTAGSASQYQHRTLGSD